MKALLLLALCLGSSVALGAPFDWHPGERQARAALEADNPREVATDAFDTMFHVAAHVLVDHDYPDESNQLLAEWYGQNRAKMLGQFSDVGDHKPVSQWVEGWYAKLEALLGVKVMDATHLRDIWVLNYTLPVVFNAEASNDWCTDELAAHPFDTCEAEYRRHFVGTKYILDPFATDIDHDGFSGVVTYWTVWALCEGATWGSGWFVICTPAGDLGEQAMERWVAPRLSNDLYERKNAQ